MIGSYPVAYASVDGAVAALVTVELFVDGFFVTKTFGAGVGTVSVTVAGKLLLTLCGFCLEKPTAVARSLPPPVENAIRPLNY